MRSTELNPSSSEWYSSVESAKYLEEGEHIEWDDSADVVVVGYGGAGIAAALQAAEDGAHVIALDIYAGGGSTAMNGGIIYAGGGTSVQKDAGIQDNTEEMFKYLELETRGIIKDETLRRFCNGSPAMIDWLSNNGVKFDSTLYSKKTSYPPMGYFLYHPDSSLTSEYAAIAKPAARGHKVYSPPSKAVHGFGKWLTEPLQDRASQKGVRFMASTEVTQLIMSAGGSAAGVKISQIPPGRHAEEYNRCIEKAAKYQTMLPPSIPGSSITLGKAKKYWKKASAIKAAQGIERFIEAKYGIVISAGGFIQNRLMVEHYAQPYAAAMPMGSPGDNGSGLRLGQTVGAATDLLERISSWRFLNPPRAFGAAMLVNGEGARYCNESMYGAVVGQHMGDEQDGKGLLILDRDLYREAWRQVFKDEMQPFQRQPAILALLFGCKKSTTLADLATRHGFDYEILKNNVEAYNRANAGWEKDVFNKDQKDMQPIARGPFYVIDMSVGSAMFPLPTMTVGGLKVNEETGEVLNQGGEEIQGLYAAGRTAIGLPSNLYVSGLSAADCIFSGRRAGAHAAAKKH
jgi:3-oxo-5alpha-steroid 4-dehydrogenase